MKTTIFLLLTIFLTSYQVVSQILPVEDFASWEIEDMETCDGITYVKDVNNKLEKYTGTWKGTKDGISYEIKVEKMIKEPFSIFLYKQDALSLKYKITSASGIVLENTLDLEIGDANDNLILDGYELYDKNDTYAFYYSERGGNCGQSGILYVGLHPGFESLSMYLRTNEWYSFGKKSSCPNGRVAPILPTTFVSLTKEIDTSSSSPVEKIKEDGEVMAL